MKSKMTKEIGTCVGQFFFIENALPGISWLYMQLQLTMSTQHRLRINYTLKSHK